MNNFVPFAVLVVLNANNFISAFSLAAASRC